MSANQPSSSNLQLNPNVSVDCVIFGFDFEELKVLLVDRSLPGNEETGPKQILLPGDLIMDDENLDTAARRVLKELTGLENIYLEQFRAFGDPERVKNPRDVTWLQSIRERPDARVVTVAYYSLVKLEDFRIPENSWYAGKAAWHPMSEVPELGFDHQVILASALEALKTKLRMKPVGFELLPEKFTLGQLQKLYETILGFDLDKRNFRRKILNKGYLVPLNEKQQGVAHKPAQFYQFDKAQYEALQEEYFSFDF